MTPARCNPTKALAKLLHLPRHSLGFYSHQSARGQTMTHTRGALLFCLEGRRDGSLEPIMIKCYDVKLIVKEFNGWPLTEVRQT